MLGEASPLRIRERLARTGDFWDRVDGVLAAIGFDAGYVGRLPVLSTGGLPKNIKDQVWGMMEFELDELAIIDTPLLQRLRRVAQLGMTFLTYPSAEHSRFAHTLGVAHVVKKLLASISVAAQRSQVLQAGSEEYPLYDPLKMPALARSLSHAALLHDVGHLAFSHAGEGAFMAASGVLVGGVELEDFVGFFREEGFESSLSECLSIAVCLSPRFAAFYGKIVGTTDLDQRLREVCCFIGGVPHDHAYPGLANLISGVAVDADKIDYLNRDAQQCGIPVGVDMSRVFLNSALVRIDEGQALALSQSRGRHAEGRRFSAGTHFIVNSSGIDTYDELANAKSVLYQRVYLHQLTRNAEQVLAEALRGAIGGATSAGSPDPKDVLSWFPFGDHELLAKLSREPASRRAAMRLVTRHLPKRAFALFRDACEPFVALHDVFDPREWAGRDGPSALSELDVVYHRRTCWRLFDQLVPLDPDERPRKLKELRTRIKAEAIEARRVLDSKFDPRTLGEGEPYVGLSPRFELKPINEVLVREKNSIGHSGQWTKSEELSTADNIGRGVDYVHADQEWRTYVAVACVKVLYEFNVDEAPSTIPDGTEFDGERTPSELSVRARLLIRTHDVCARAGLDQRRLVETMHDAARAGYFGASERVVPLLDAQTRECRSVAEHYAAFKGERGWRVTEGSVSAFVRQFPVGLRSEMIAVLGRGTVIGRGAIRGAVDRVVAELVPAKTGTLVLTRFSPNSGNVVGMTLEQERKLEYERAGHEFVRSLSELDQRLARGGVGCVVFLDDQFATGGQAHAQLLHWAGLPREEWPASIRTERNIDIGRAGDSTLAFLKKGKVRLAFVHGTAAGKARIASAASDLGFSDLAAIYDEEIPPRPAGLSADLKDHLAKVGYQLLRGVRHGDASTLDAEQEGALRGDVLGYGNVGTVMVTASSAPSHALTALWCPGVHDGQPWIPLFLRRGYRKDLVLG